MRLGFSWAFEHADRFRANCPFSVIIIIVYAFSPEAQKWTNKRKPDYPVRFQFTYFRNIVNYNHLLTERNDGNFPIPSSKLKTYFV